MFRNQGTEYYGDNDELNGKLLEEEEELARTGQLQFLRLGGLKLINILEWEEAVAETANALSISVPPSIPFPSSSKPFTSHAPQTETPAAPTPKKGKGKGKSKRKAGPNDPEGETDEGEAAKKAKTDETSTNVTPAVQANNNDEAVKQAAAIAASFLGVLDPASLRMPDLPTTEQMGQILLDVRKKALMEEYGVSS